MHPTHPNDNAPGWLSVAVALDGRRCLVVGGGAVGERRCRQLLAAGAQVTVVAPSIGAGIEESGARCRRREFNDRDLDNIDLVVVATDDAALNDQIAAEARARRLWVNAAHHASEGDWLFAPTARRGDLSISVSTGGRAPPLARHLAHEIGARYGAPWGRAVDLLARWRKRLAESGMGGQDAKAFWHRVLSGAFIERLLGGDEAEAERLLEREKERILSGGEREGIVFLVGAGPGDPRLLTLRALDILNSVDVVLYDRLVSTEILAMIPGHIEKINVGKESQRPSLGQKPINELMLQLARSGRDVARLKGGDPFIFGRGGEEIIELASSGVVFEVIPGISAANGCACYYGIPLTHRDFAHSCLLMTAHRRLGAEVIDWARLAQAEKQTLVLYMGNYRLAEVARSLKEAGCPGERPLALISCGTTTAEKTYMGTVNEVIECPPNLDSPAIAIVGEVVRLSHRLNWRARASAEAPTVD